MNGSNYLENIVPCTNNSSYQPISNGMMSSNQNSSLPNVSYAGHQMNSVNGMNTNLIGTPSNNVYSSNYQSASRSMMDSNQIGAQNSIYTNYQLNDGSGMVNDLVRAPNSFQNINCQSMNNSNYQASINVARTTNYQTTYVMTNSLNNVNFSVTPAPVQSTGCTGCSVLAEMNNKLFSLIEKEMEDHKDVISKMREDHKDAISKMREDHKDAISKMREDHKEMVELLKARRKRKETGRAVARGAVSGVDG